MQPRFSKIIIDPESNILRIPVEFTRRYGSNLPDTVFLKVPSGSRLWKIELIRAGDGEIWFGNGWKEFRDHYSMQFGHQLFFQFDYESSKFDVWILDETAVEIHYPVYPDYPPDHADGQEFGSAFSISESQKGDRPNENTDQLGGSEIETSKRFTKELTVSHAYRILLPRKFTEGTSITTKREITVLDVKGRKWPFRVMYCRRDRIYAICAGWNNFLINNEVSIGSTMTFTFVPSSENNTIEAQVMKTGTDRTKLFKYVKSRGGRLQFLASLATSDQERRSGTASSSVDHGNDEGNEYELHDSKVSQGKIYTSPKGKEKIVEHCCTVPMTGKKRLKTGDILANPVGKSARKVNLGGDCCTEITDQLDGSRVEASKRFTKQLTANHAYRVELSKEFTEGTFITTNREIVVKDINGRKWPVRVNYKSREGQYEICGGWNNFLKNNGVSIGCTMSFTFVPSSENTIEARVEKMGTDRNKLFNYVRRRGGTYQFIPSLAKNDQARRAKEASSSVDHSNDEGNEYKLHDSVVFLGEISKSQKGKEKAVEHCLTVPMTGRKRPNTGDLLGNPVKKSAKKVKLGVDGHTKTADNEDSSNGQGGVSSIGMSWGFNRQLTTSNAYRLVLPREFTGSIGITADSHIMVRDVKGRKWPIHVVCRKHGRYEICAGWNNFLRNNDVITSNTISFTFISRSNNVIEVQVVKTGADIRKILNNGLGGGRVRSIASLATRNHARKRPKTVSSTVDSESDYRTTERENGSRVGKIWKFSMKLKKHHAYRLDISKDFAKGTGLASGNEMILKDAEGRLWPVGVISNRKRSHRFFITAVWKDFLVGNKVAEGNTITLKHFPCSGNLFEARVLNNERNGKLFAKRAVGRPPSSKAKLSANQ